MTQARSGGAGARVLPDGSLGGKEGEIDDEDDGQIGRRGFRRDAEIDHASGDR
jgi:hypothetical protein